MPGREPAARRGEDPAPEAGGLGPASTSVPEKLPACGPGRAVRDARPPGALVRSGQLTCVSGIGRAVGRGSLDLR